MTVQIICINKDNGNHQNPHMAISYYGWVDVTNSADNGKASRQQMVNFLKTSGNNAFVSNDRTKAYCYVRTSAVGTKFLQTKSDGQWSNNLLSLPECKA